MLQQSNRPYEAFSRERREQLAIGYRSSGTKGRTKASITVVVRKRPLTNTEISRHESDILSVKDDCTSIQIDEPRKNVCGLPYIEPHTFAFDRAYSETDTNQLVYQTCVSQLVESVFEENARCSCFAYGQTGSGKTYTMMGPKRVNGKPSPVEHQGLLEQAARDIFQNLNKTQFKQAELHVSFLEIYCNRIYDLMNQRRNVRALETKLCGGVVVRGLTVIKVKTIEDLLKCVNTGIEQRIVASNSKNNDSSRGHAILTLDVRKEKCKNSIGKLAFIDLAGSERGADAMGAGKSTQVDGAGINRSLLALKECIRSLDQQNNHIPFRDSELTKVLRDMFTGSNAKTLMISCVSPSSACCEQTLNTLRYADRVKAMRRSENNIISDPIATKSDAESAHKRTKESSPPTMASTERLPRHKSISPGKHYKHSRSHRRIDRLSEVSASTSQHSQVSDEPLLSSFQVSKSPCPLRTPRHTIQSVKLFTETPPLKPVESQSIVDHPNTFKSKRVDKILFNNNFEPKTDIKKFKSRTSNENSFYQTRRQENIEPVTDIRMKTPYFKTKNKANIKTNSSSSSNKAINSDSVIPNHKKKFSLLQDVEEMSSRISEKKVETDKNKKSTNKNMKASTPTNNFYKNTSNSHENSKELISTSNQPSSNTRDPITSNLMRAAAEFLSKRYKQIEFPIDYPLKVKEPMSLQTAMHLLEQLIDLSAVQLHEYYTTYHEKCQNSFNELIHFHADCMKRQSISIMQQKKVMTEFESKTAERKYPIDHDYLIGLRENLKVIISSSHRLEKRLADVEGMEAFLLYVHDVYLKVKNEECFNDNTTDSIICDTPSHDAVLIDSKNLDPPVVSSRFTTASSAGEVKIFCNSNQLHLDN